MGYCESWSRFRCYAERQERYCQSPRRSPQRERERLYQPSHRRSHRARRKRSCGIWWARRGIIEERRAIPPLLLHICGDVLKVGFEIRAFRCIEGLIWNETLATVQIRRSLRRFEIRAVKLASIWDRDEFFDLKLMYSEKQDCQKKRIRLLFILYANAGKFEVFSWLFIYNLLPYR